MIFFIDTIHMREIDIITETQLIEGIVGAVLMPLLLFFFKHTEGNSFIIGSMLSFFFTWLARKFFVNNLAKYKKQQGKPDYMFKI